MAGFIFDRGTHVGLLAQRRYPGGREIEAKYNELPLALEQTSEAMLDTTTTALFEPAFEFGAGEAGADAAFEPAFEPDTDAAVAAFTPVYHEASWRGLPVAFNTATVSSRLSAGGRP